VAAQRRAVLWEPTGEMLDLGTLGGASAEALGINEAGDVVGIAETATGEFQGVPVAAFGGDGRHHAVARRRAGRGRSTTSGR
jgi:uncharacterized membrane protein